MKTDLRLTDTNAASDSKGRTWGLEGGLFWWLVGGVGAGITLFCVCLLMLNSSLLTSFGLALVPVTFREPGAPRPLDDSLLEEAVEYAVTAAAITCTKRGAVPPSRGELDAWIGTSQEV